MQTFLPYADFAASAVVLDDRRLGKQRVETYQVLRALTFASYGWKNHPAVRMWRGFVPALVAYGLAMCDEWSRRGFADTVAESMLAFTGARSPDIGDLTRRGQVPQWLGSAPLHLSHRSALVQKEPEHYRAYFPDVPDDLPYLWPPPVYPTWPVRGRELALAEALLALGYAHPRPGQAETVVAVRRGHDVLLATPAGYGGTTAALLAALTGRGPTLWLSPAAGPHADVGEEPPVLAPRTPRSPQLPRASAAPGAPAARTATAPPELTARPPGPADLAAMAAEATAAPDVLFYRPRQLTAPGVAQHLGEASPALVVLDAPGELEPADATAVASVRQLTGDVPLLAICGPAGPARRQALQQRLALRTPVLVGGGFDLPRVHLTVEISASESDRRARLAAQLRTARPGLVLAPDRQRAERIAAALERSGLRTAAVAPEMRTGRVASALASYRSGRLDAVVAPLGAALELGRARVRAVHLAGPPPSLEALHAALSSLSGRRAYDIAAGIFVLESEIASATPEVAAYLTATDCRRARLLDVFGEPVPIPCRRCDLCSRRDGYQVSC
ncbi:MAG: MSMEG_6728 family protein [Actinomycetota bacterium]|nr:MSMEG_6728 family protein [Actinomycetota bacterium]